MNRPRIASFLFTILSAAGLMAPVRAQVQAPAQDLHLAITTPARLVDCAPVTETPCMSAGLSPVDAAGRPAPVTLPAPHDLARAFTLRSGEAEIHPFYASAGLGPDAAQHSNVALFLVDISGSMNQPAPGSASRFLAVKAALKDYLDGMQEGVDRVAILPFESHNVLPTLHSAVYVSSKADALAQLNALPTPSPKNNTALYQAVFTGVQSLEEELHGLEKDGHAASELQPHLIVLTDGKNEVLPGDDPQLLTGDLGLQQAAAQVQASHLDVLGIGFGDRAAVDTAALSRLSTRFIFATDAEQLLAALHSSRTASSHQIQLTWLLPENDRLALMGRDPSWIAELSLPGGSRPTSDDLRVLVPATTAPVYDRRAAQTELNALIAAHPPANSGWSTVLVYYLLALVAIALLLALWFWLPRLIWGDRYLEALPSPKKKWASDRPAMTSASGVQIRSTNIPTGFEPADEAQGTFQRSAAQTTQVQPREAFSRTRLTFDQK